MMELQMRCEQNDRSELEADKIALIDQNTTWYRHAKARHQEEKKDEAAGPDTVTEEGAIGARKRELASWNLEVNNNTTGA